MYLIRNFIQLISYMIILYKVYFIIVYFMLYILYVYFMYTYVRIVIRKIQYIILITAGIYIIEYTILLN